MEIKELKEFLTLAETLNFTEASRICATSPSTMSRNIKRLEDEFDILFFKRDSRSVNLTDAGIEFVKFAHQILSEYIEIKQRLKDTQSPITGRLKIYCSVTASLFLLPKILGKFRLKHPYVEIKIETGDAALALPKLKSDDADLAIAAVPNGIPHEFFATELAKIPLVFIGPRQVPQSWRNGTDFCWKDLPYIVSEQGELRNQINIWFKNRHISVPHIYAESAGHEAIVSMVALGMGAALIPEAVVQASSLGTEVQIIARPPEISPFNVSLCTKINKLKQKIISVFLEIAKETSN